MSAAVEGPAVVLAVACPLTPSPNARVPVMGGKVGSRNDKKSPTPNAQAYPWRPRRKPQALLRQPGHIDHPVRSRPGDDQVAAQPARSRRRSRSKRNDIAAYRIRRQRSHALVVQRKVVRDGPRIVLNHRRKVHRHASDVRNRDRLRTRHSSDRLRSKGKRPRRNPNQGQRSRLSVSLRRRRNQPQRIRRHHVAVHARAIGRRLGSVRHLQLARRSVARARTRQHKRRANRRRNRIVVIRRHRDGLRSTDRIQRNVREVKHSRTERRHRSSSSPRQRQRPR